MAKDIPAGTAFMPDERLTARARLFVRDLIADGYSPLDGLGIIAMCLLFIKGAQAEFPDWNSKVDDVAEFAKSWGVKFVSSEPEDVQ